MVRKVAPEVRAMQPLAIMGMGWAVVISIVLGIGGGLWLDGQLGTTPFLTLGGLVFGLGGAYAAARNLIAQTRR